MCAPAPSRAGESALRDVLARGLAEMQRHYGRSHVTIADAVNHFHAQTTRERALPSLAVACALLDAHGAGLDRLTRPGVARLWRADLVQRWRSL